MRPNVVSTAGTIIDTEGNLELRALLKAGEHAPDQESLEVRNGR